MNFFVPHSYNKKIVIFLFLGLAFSNHAMNHLDQAAPPNTPNELREEEENMSIHNDPLYNQNAARNRDCRNTSLGFVLGTSFGALVATLATLLFFHLYPPLCE